MPAAAAAAALHSSLGFSSPKLTPQPSLSQQPNTQSAAKSKSLLHKHPLYTPAHTNISFEIKEKILCLEIMGVDSGKALSQNPSLHAASLGSIESIIFFLQSKGIQQKDLPRIFGMCPKLLTSDIRTDLKPVFNFLYQDLKIPENNFRRAINKCPRLLVSSARDQLKPCLFYLQRLGFEDLEALAYQDPVLLVSNVENTLIPKLKYLESIGFSRDEAVAMVLRCPALFTFSVENNFKPKFDYFAEEMKGKLKELKGFPQYFAFSLDKRIKPRHVEAVQSGVKIPLPLMLKSTDEEFVNQSLIPTKLRDLLLAGVDIQLPTRPITTTTKICFFWCTSSLLHSRPKSTVGSPAYIALELISRREYDGKLADVWSCGVTPSGMLVGAYPFEDPKNFRKTINRIMAVQYKIPNYVHITPD